MSLGGFHGAAPISQPTDIPNIESLFAMMLEMNVMSGLTLLLSLKLFPSLVLSYVGISELAFVFAVMVELVPTTIH